MTVASAATWICSDRTWGAPPQPEGHRLATFDGSTGETYFALSLMLDSAPTARSGSDVLVLMDTSASQVGLYRQDSLAALESLLAGLGDEDRVRLVAVDVNAVPLHDSWSAPRGSDLRGALAKLRARTPLGSTDLAKGLQSAIKSFDPEATRPRCVIYVGDGASRAKWMGPEQVRPLVEQLRAERVTVSSLAIGPRRDILLLSTLANQTGGMVLVDSDEVPSAMAGNQLALSTQATVYWPTEVEMPSFVQESYPSPLPPIRSDRDTIVVGQLQDREGGELVVRAEGFGGPAEMQWNLVPEEASPDFAFLSHMIEVARTDDGRSLPTAGSAALMAAAQAIMENAHELTKLGGYALLRGDVDGAQRTLDAALKVDPLNTEAEVLQNAIGKYRVAQTEEGEARPGDDSSLRLGGASADPSADLLEYLDRQPGADLSDFEQQRRVRAQVVQEEVLNQLAQIRRLPPERATQELKLLLESVRQATEIEMDVRNQLSARIRSAIREASRLEFEEEEQRAIAEESRAAAQEARRIAEELGRRDERLKQLMERFNSLMVEGRYQDADREIADPVRELAPDLPATMAATWNARFQRQFADIARFRDLRHRNFADALYSVEEALIPFTDADSIIYPSPERWQELTIKREKYKSVDMAGSKPRERRIFEELGNVTIVQFDETPLQDVVDTLSDQHGIDIIIDRRALTDAAIPTDIGVTANLNGVTLRSALRIMLGELDLSFMIRNEVLQITTTEVTEENLITKVYPVGDLVIPILGGGMGGMMGGMGGMGMMGGMGGMGGMMGGMGGMGGMMGGMGGMGGMGMGGMGMGGMFVVEEDLRLGKPKAQPTRSPEAPETSEASPGEASAIPVPAASNRSASNSSDRPRRIRPAGAKAGADPLQVWRAHFAAHEPRPADVRETVRQLMNEKKFSETAAVIQAALLEGQTQAWMYEALALALYAGNASSEELERALMSAVEFATNEDEVMNIAKFMANFGMEERALSLLKQVAAAFPLRPEPYMFGLELARRTDNLEGVRWACHGILGQAWGREHVHVAQKAFNVAQATLAELVRDERHEEAQAFEDSMVEALRRDCIVQVTWTGDADVDLLVQEPSGDVSSLSNPRTSGGGVMLGDSYARAGKATADGYSEMYVCPQGFSGEYRLLVRRVWGEVTAGKVTVDIITNYGSRDERRIREQLPLAEKDALVVFEVPKGRRVEHLAQPNIEHIARDRQDLANALVAQQLRMFERLRGDDSLSDRDLDLARRHAAMLRAGRFPMRGAVGFMPVVETIPEGTMLMPPPVVISADRRYVRFTSPMMPIFTGIGDVFTFNFISGEEGQGTGGGGGVGGGPGGGMGGMGMGGMGMGGGF
jgi:hypothetical protein